MTTSTTSSSTSLFTRVSKTVAAAAGHPPAFIAAASVIVLWAVTGPIFAFNETWQLVINTGTTIVTFLMVFLIQNSQNRDTAALQLKLDELIHIAKGADDRLLDLEELDEQEIEEKRDAYEALAEKARENDERNSGKS